MVVALLAVLKAGGAWVPLDPESPPERLALLLADAGVPLVLTPGARAGPRRVGRRLLVLDDPATSEKLAAEPAAA